MLIDNIRKLVKSELEALDNLIKQKIQSQISLINKLTSHIIESGGKRLRPLLVLLTSKACGYQNNHNILLAAMIEFFHTATLLHDDVIDESKMRRGKQTANEIWGTKASILVGDYLFTQHMQLMLEVGNLEIMQLIADTSYSIGVGEIKQLGNRHNPCLDIEEYFDVIRAKTSYLFAASSKIGAIISNAPTDTSNALYDYGLYMGNAFQIVDDALDYCADVEVTGKNIGDDLADGKVTLPLIYTLESANEVERNLIHTSLIEGNLNNLKEIIKIIKKTNAIELTYEKAQEEVEKAISALEVLPDSEYKTALKNLAFYAIKREH